MTNLFNRIMNVTQQSKEVFKKTKIRTLNRTHHTAISTENFKWQKNKQIAQFVLSQKNVTI